MIVELLRKFKDQRILVLGDLMLDHYVWGQVERISPEAPVPVLEAQNEEYRPGGAANVALNLRSLGAQVLLVGCVGRDAAADTLRRMLAERGIAAEGLIEAQDRRTTLKTRIGAVNQQIVRIDYETKTAINASQQKAILAKIESLLPGCSALVVEDYDKGLLSPQLIDAVLNRARSLNVPVAVDPKQRNFLAYREVEIFKPNYTEFQAILGKVLVDETQFFSAAKDLRERLGIQNLVVTHGAQGMYIFAGAKQPLHLPTCAREVYDVSGAGDTVISALTLAWICSRDIRLAADLANHAAGVVCGIKGTASVSPDQLLASFNEPR